MRKIGYFGLALVLLGFIAACTSPFAAQQGSGILRLSGVQSGEIGSQTVFPTVDLSGIDSYEVTLKDGPNEAEFESKTTNDVDDSGQIKAGENLQFEDLVPGEWTVEVEGFSEENGNGDLLVSGSAENVQINRGEFNEVDVTVYLIDDPPDDETGDWELDLTWPSDADIDGDYSTTDVVTDYSVSFEPFDGQDDSDATIDETDALNGTQLSLSGTDFEPGPYLMDIELYSDNKSPYKTVARYTEIWYVYGNQTTARAEGEPGDGAIALAESDFSFGGGSRFGVNVEELEDLNQFFEGSEDSTVASDSEFTITSDLQDSAGNDLTADQLTWRINDQEVSDGDDIEITEGENEDPVGRLTDVTLENDGSDLRFTPNEGVNENGDFDNNVDFPAGVTLNVTLVVENDGEYYSGDHSVTVEEAQ
ncbi:MAG: hypothetical protein ACOCZ9_02965 [Spirochaetota bacterium]